MIPIRKIVDYVAAEPFRPFRIKMASGQFFDIRHPENILVGRGSVRVFEPAEGNGEGHDRWHDVSMMLMESLEPLEPSTA
jgi:hypothetical protein